MLDAPVPGKRRKGRQKTKWKDSFKRGKESVGLKEEGVGPTGQDKVEELYSIPLRRPQMMAKAREGEEEEERMI